MTNEESYLSGDDPGSQESNFKIKDLLLSLLTRWHWLLLGALLGVSWGFYQAWKEVPQYRSQAVVLVRDYSVSVLQTIDAADFDVRSSAALETVRTGLMKFELCERVASEPRIRSLKGLVPPPPKKLFENEDEKKVGPVEVPPAPQLGGMIRSWLEVNLQAESRLMTVSIRHPEPTVAATIANAIVDGYIEQRAEIKELEKDNDSKVLEVQADRLTNKLAQSRARQAIYDTPNRAELALVSAELELNNVQLRYRAKHPKYIEASRKVDLARSDLRESLERAVRNPTDAEFWQKNADVAAALDQEGGLEILREKLIERRAQLETEIESQKNISETLLAQAERTEVNKAQNEAEVIPYEKARPNGTPFTAGKASLLTKNGLFGLIAGAALALLFHLLDNKFHTVSDLESKIPLPVLAAVPQISAKALKKIKGEVIPGREGWEPTLLFARDNTQTVMAESFRVLRANLALLGPGEDRKTTLVTSSLPSEGKTTVASNLACAMAHQGQKVVLVDMDLRKPSVHKAFGLKKDGKMGVVNVLSGQAGVSEVVITDTGLERLDLILSGPKAPNPGELLDSSRLARFLEWLTTNYDHVVIDSAPVLAVADSRLLAPLVSNFCFVVRADQTPKGAVQRALDILAKGGKSPSGIVFNNFQERRIAIGRNYSYGYYRGKHYAYGTYGSEE